MKNPARDKCRCEQVLILTSIIESLIQYCSPTNRTSASLFIACERKLSSFTFLFALKCKLKNLVHF
jgi:hypothetical protein